MNWIRDWAGELLFFVLYAFALLTSFALEHLTKTKSRAAIVGMIFGIVFSRILVVVSTIWIVLWLLDVALLYWRSLEMRWLPQITIFVVTMWIFALLFPSLGISSWLLR